MANNFLIFSTITIAAFSPGSVKQSIS
jgi:hypothetical protein